MMIVNKTANSERPLTFGQTVRKIVYQHTEHSCNGSVLFAQNQTRLKVALHAPLIKA